MRVRWWKSKLEGTIVDNQLKEYPNYLYVVWDNGKDDWYDPKYLVPINKDCNLQQGKDDK